MADNDPFDYSAPSPNDQSSNRTSHARRGGSARPLSRPSLSSRQQESAHGQQDTRRDLAGFDAPQSSATHATSHSHNAGQAQRSKPRPVRLASSHKQATASPQTVTYQDQASHVPSLNEPPRRPRKRLSRKLRLIRTLCIALILVLIAWPTGLALWTNSHIKHVDALSGAANTPGETYLLAGADIEQGGAQRTDTLMLLHKAPNGREYLVSIPRDTLVDIPGHGKYKINAAYSFGGASLLVQTMENFTGLTIDHFLVIGFSGVEDVVDSIGTVNLCIDRDVDDVRSGLKMTKGCHDVGGQQALAFVRARYFDPTADIGRQQRQQQFVGSLMKSLASPSVLLNPFTQAKLADAGSRSIQTDQDTGLIDIAQAALVMRGASNSNNTLTMPIEDPGYRTKHSGIAIKVNDEDIAAFFNAIKDGSAKPAASRN